jgi:hypothetical protein
VRLLHSHVCPQGHSEEVSLTTPSRSLKTIIILLTQFPLRHMEDGCSKRFDIGTMDLRAEAGYDNMHPSARSMAPMSHMMAPSGGLPPIGIPPLCGPGMLGSMPPSMRPRESLAGGDHQGHSWGR